MWVFMTSDCFFYTILNTQAIKDKIDKLDVIRIDSICALKDVIKKIEKWLREMGKICTSLLSDKGVTSRIYKECFQLNNKKTIQFLKRESKTELPYDPKIPL